MVGRAIGMAALALALAPAQVHAQGIGSIFGVPSRAPAPLPAPSSTLAPNSTPSPASQADDGVLPAIPRNLLRTNEAIAPFKGGKCATIVDTRVNSPTSQRDVEWIGACPGGLADGPGLVVRPDGTTSRLKYVAGFAPRWTRKSDWQIAYNSTFMADEPILRFQSKRRVYLDRFIKGDAFQIDEVAVDGSWVAHNYAIGTFACPFRGLPEPGVPENVGSFERAATHVCNNGVAGEDGRPDAYPDPKYVAHFRTVFDASGRRYPETFEVAICEYIAADPEHNNTPCHPAFRALIAPFRARLEAMMAQEPALIASAEADVRARFGPYIAARKAQARAAALQFAAQYRPRSLPPLALPARAAPARPKPGTAATPKGKRP